MRTTNSKMCVTSAHVVRSQSPAHSTYNSKRVDNLRSFINAPPWAANIVLYVEAMWCTIEWAYAYSTFRMLGGALYGGTLPIWR